MFRTRRHLLGALAGALFVAWFTLRPILPGTGVPPDFSFIRGDWPVASATAEPEVRQAGNPWVYQAWAEPAVDRATSTAAYITIDRANVNPPASDADISIWLGSSVIPGDEDDSGFIQVGYLVRPGDRFYLFAETSQPAGAVTCEPPTLPFLDGRACIAPLPFAGDVRPGNAYWFEADAQKDSVALAVAGHVLMHVAYPPDADRLLDPGYPDVEVTAQGAHSPPELIGLGLVVRGEFGALASTDAGGRWLHESGLRSEAHGWYTEGGEFPEANVLCPPITQQGGFDGRPDSYRAGDFGGECFASGTQLTDKAVPPQPLNDLPLPPPLGSTPAPAILPFDGVNLPSLPTSSIDLALGLEVILLGAAMLVLPRWRKETGAKLLALRWTALTRMPRAFLPLLAMSLLPLWWAIFNPLTFGLLALGGGLFALSLWRGTELRERGIISDVRFIPWSTVTAYGWAWQNGGVLVLRGDGLTGPFAKRDIVLNVPSEVRPEVNRILDVKLAGKVMPAEEAQQRADAARSLRTPAESMASFISIATLAVMVIGFIVVTAVGMFVVLRVQEYERQGVLPPVQQIVIPIGRVKSWGRG